MNSVIGAFGSTSIFPEDTATKLIEALTGVLSANMPIIIALLGFTLLIQT